MGDEKTNSELQPNVQRPVEKFGDAPGLPAVEHAKNRIREKKQRKADAPGTKTFYTLKGEKILILTMKHNGCYSSYFGNTAKMDKQIVASQIAKWKTAGKWLEQHEVKAKAREIIPTLHPVKG